jgi:short-subunit dehydrogenase
VTRLVLVTGASSGIGALVAAQLAARGDTVYAASRRGTAPDGCRGLSMDVDRDDSVASGIAHVLAQAQRIDAVVACAGWGIAGAVEDTTADEGKAQLETNFFGAHRVVRAVLPSMRTQAGGRIVLVSSLVAQIPVPYQAFYSASKAALSSYAEALRLELAPFGVRVTCVEPGNFRTGFTGARRRSSGWTATSPYAASTAASIEWMEHDEQRAPPADAVAEVVIAALYAVSPPFRRVVVAHAFERVGVWLRAVLPYRLYEAIALKVFRVK